MNSGQNNTATGGAAAYHGKAQYIGRDLIQLSQVIHLDETIATVRKPQIEEAKNIKRKEKLKISIQDLFESKDARDNCITNVENKLSFEMYSAPQLFDYYAHMVQMDGFDEAAKSGVQLLNILTSIEISPSEAQEYACQLQKEEPLKSFFFHLFAMRLCFLKDEITTFELDVITHGFKEIAAIVETMVFEEKLSKHIVYQHIVKNLILINDELKQNFQQFPQNEDKVKEFAEVNANQCFFISRCQLAIHDYIGCERTLKEAIHFYKDAFSDDLSQTRLYGVFLHYLGLSFWARRLKHKANEFFNLAGEKLKHAGDELKHAKLFDPEKRREILETNKRLIALSEPLESAHGPYRCAIY